MTSYESYCPFLWRWHLPQKAAFSPQYLWKDTTAPQMQLPHINLLRRLLTLELPCEEEHVSRSPWSWHWLKATSHGSKWKPMGVEKGRERESGWDRGDSRAVQGRVLSGRGKRVQRPDLGPPASLPCRASWNWQHTHEEVDKPIQHYSITTNEIGNEM